MPITEFTPKSEDLIEGLNYKIRLTSGIWVLAEFRGHRRIPGRPARFSQYGGEKERNHFLFLNLSSDRTIEIKSRIRIRGLQTVNGSGC